ncbi:MAG: hypothetical protein CSA18_02420 [Deltaproteobacteria bacterium]|nr:MAG: hypothetical protein CSB21_01045 [Deltaproteobacteria bacterium]PIE74982.1 MAG: hypothetical protein CSA18_02420 [Deltaproteobacteria bacterium]
MIKVIDKYILKELLSPFIVSLLFFSFIFLLSRMLDIADMLVNYNISFLSVLRLMLFSICFLLKYVIPMSVMMSVFFVFIEMNSSNEILALKSGGAGVFRIFAPAAFFCLAGVIFTAFMTFYGVPWGKYSFTKEVYHIAENNLSIAFKEKTFLDSFKGFVLFIDKIDKHNNKISKIFIEDRKTGQSPVTITAPEGFLLKTESGYKIELLNGSIIQIFKNDLSVHKTFFDKYSFIINVPGRKKVAGTEEKDDDEMYFDELNKYIKNFKTEHNKYYYSALLRKHEIIALPFSCFFLGMIAFSVGLKNSTGKKSSGILYGVLFFILYYLLLAAGWSLGESKPEICPPAVGMWVPNAVMFIIGSILLYLCDKEKEINLKFRRRS